MSKYKEPAYTAYVRHAMRFYASYPNTKVFRSESDRANWQACHRALRAYPPISQQILMYVYGERDTLGDNVYNASKLHSVHQDTVWEMMREFERRIAMERGLL